MGNLRSGTTEYASDILDTFSPNFVSTDSITALWANNVSNAVVAIQNKLGSTPQGTFGSVQARLDTFFDDANTRLLGTSLRLSSGVIRRPDNTGNAVTFGDGSASFLQDEHAFFNAAGDAEIARFVGSTLTFGIGTSTPSAPIHIVKSNTVHMIMQGTASDTVGIQFGNATTGVSSTDGFFIGIDSNETGLISMRENNSIAFSTNNTQRMVLDNSGALVVGSPTGGGANGAGTINAEAVYDDNVLLSCYVIEQATTGHVDLAYWDLVSGGEHKPAHAFANRAHTILSLPSYIQSWKDNGHLPAMPSRTEWAAQRGSVGRIVQSLWETVECQAVHIATLHQRLEAIEAGS